jgi:hypothetical protein
MGLHPEPSLIFRKAARGSGLPITPDKLERHFERAIDVGDSEQLARAAGESSSWTLRLRPLSSGSPGWCNDADGHPVHHLRLRDIPGRSLGRLGIPPTRSTPPTPSSLHDVTPGRPRTEVSRAHR